MLNELKKEIKKKSNKLKAESYKRFFKTGKGGYSEKEIFLGVTVPDLRKISKKYCNLTFEELYELLSSNIHEYKMISLLILIDSFKKSKETIKNKIFSFYTKNIKHINNWDLIDLSAPNIIGAYLFENKNKLTIIYNLSKSNNFWKRRVAILSTLYLIRKKEFNETFKISKLLIYDKNNLVQKAVGWMLREVGKRDIKSEKRFLKKYYKLMPRQMLRYAIEKFDKETRKKYLLGQI